MKYQQQQSLSSKIWGWLLILNRLDWVGRMNSFPQEINSRHTDT